MKKSTVLAIDLAKTTLQLGKFEHSGKVIYNRAVSRQQLKDRLASEPPALVAMEACGGAHYWARFAKRCGHQVKLMHARSVKAFRTGQKTDRNDTQAIAIAAWQPTIRSVQVLSTEAQAAQSLDRARRLADSQCVALSNQIRGLLTEFGIVFPLGHAALQRRIHGVLEDGGNGLPDAFRELLWSLWRMLEALRAQADELQRQLTQRVQEIEACQRLLALEGVGPVGAFRLWLSLGDGAYFTSGKNAAACLGLTPKQHSSGGKERIGHISRFSADQPLRSTLYQGALAVIRQLKRRAPRTAKERWLAALVQRRGTKVAAIALANKTVRTAYALLSQHTAYQPQ